MKAQLKRVSVCLILFFLTAASCGLYAEDSSRHFGIEVFGGFSLIDPADLNNRVEMDRQYERLFRDSYYTHLVNIGAYSQATKLAGGDFKSLRQAIPVGLRVKYYFSDSLSVSIGFSYMRGAQSSNFTNHFLLSRDGIGYGITFLHVAILFNWH